jgi:proton-translocating NADH-quinone oxidoreductase chain L
VIRDFVTRDKQKSTMPSPALLLVIATLLPLVAFVVLMFAGKRMGNPFAGYVGTAFIAGSFICSILAMIAWYHGANAGTDRDWGFEKSPINLPMKWIPVGAGVNQDHPGFLDVGVFVDSLTIAMFAMITLVATLVHLFSIGYMHEDKRYPRFFTYLGLFCFSMLGLVLGGTLLQLFIFWELVGLCSYLLIGFWYEKRSASNAAIKAFVANRVGDFGFLIGFGILFYHLGNVTLPNMWLALGAAGMSNGLDPLLLPGGAAITATTATVMGIGLFFGAVGKSAQFPLHVWLPDAMEGPTPVSALIHAATMVAAGVYLVARIFPVLTPDAKMFIAVIGCITLTMAALIALAQTDIKKVLAYSTLSQLGYMILALGIGSYIGGLFHLITHAFFKALLFLGSGSVIHAAHHEQEMEQYGGLVRKLPITAITFAVAVFAISGMGITVGHTAIGFSGFYSKDMILAHAGAFATLAEHSGRSRFIWLLWLLPTIIAYVTAFYMTRCWMLTFWGKPRNLHVYEHAQETTILWVPLVVLAILSIIGGKALGVQELVEASMKENTALVRQMGKSPALAPFGTAWPAPRLAEPLAASAAAETAGESIAAHDPLEHGHHLVETYVSWAFVVGIGLAFLIYLKGYAVVAPLMGIFPLNYLRIWLYRRMYFDELYFSVFVFLTRDMLSPLAGWFDAQIIDRFVNGAAWTVNRVSMLAGLNDHYIVDGAVNGAATLTQNLGAAVRVPRSGRIRMYVTLLVAAVTLGLAGTIIVVLSR